MSNTKNSLRRSVKSNQLHMREIVIFLDQATGDVSGPDQLLVDSVVDNGNGDYTINFDPKARATYGKDMFLKGFSSKTAGTVEVQVTAVGPASIRVLAKDVAGAGLDSDLVLTVGVHDWKLEYKA